VASTAMRFIGIPFLSDDDSATIACTTTRSSSAIPVGRLDRHPAPTEGAQPRRITCYEQSQVSESRGHAARLASESKLKAEARRRRFLVRAGAYGR
jgi:hypothetical protein